MSARLLQLAAIHRDAANDAAMECWLAYPDDWETKMSWLKEAP